MKRAVKTFLLVVVLTCLIWSWAEQSQTRSLDKQTIELRIELPPSSGFAIYREGDPVPWSDSIVVKVVANFNGQQGGIHRLSQMIAGGEYPPVYAMPIEPRVRESPEDQQTVVVNLNRALSNSPVLNRLHVTVTSVTLADGGPGGGASVELCIERLKPVDLELVPRFNDGFRRASAVVSDKTARVVLPAGLLARVLREGIRLPADVQRITEANKPLPAAVARQIDGYPIRPVPETTTVTVTDSQESAEVTDYTINVPLAIMVPQGFPFQEYELVIGPEHRFKKVVVRGPPNRQDDAMKTRMYVQFDADDAKETEEWRKVIIEPPKGFQLVRPEEGNPERDIKFKFVKRKERSGT